jgi:hypothetical protein
MISGQGDTDTYVHRLISRTMRKSAEATLTFLQGLLVGLGLKAEWNT